MPYFAVDDKAHSHNKIRKVLATEPAALALWLVAGSWSADNLTDGFVPDHQLPWLMPARADELARTLVTARLWRRVRDGYRFHQWAANGDGTKRNMTREEVEERRRTRSEAGRKGGLSSGKTRSKPEASASARATAEATAVAEHPSLTLPFPPTTPPEPPTAHASPTPEPGGGDDPTGEPWTHLASQLRTAGIRSGGWTDAEAHEAAGLVQIHGTPKLLQVALEGQRPAVLRGCLSRWRDLATVTELPPEKRCDEHKVTYRKACRGCVADQLGQPGAIA